MADTMSETNSVTSFRSRFIGRLSLTKSDGTVRYFNIKRSILIGRGSECDIRIKVKTVSRVHCKVRVVAPDASPMASAVPAQFVLENVSTTNFTVVNAAEVSGQVGLCDGDVITVAERDFVFQLIDTSEPGGTAAGTAPSLIALEHVQAAGGGGHASAAPDEGSSTGIYSIFCGSPAQDLSSQRERERESSGGGCAVM